ncbi:MAG: hypothetical protein QOF96_45 [Actinomycetota bacterium]|nr:hypothetical protein [Actinomycetota bacterium]
MISFIIGLVIEGAIFGALLRAILPGEQQWTIGQTIGVGVVGWLALGILFRMVVGVIAGLVISLLVLPTLLILGGGAVYLIRRRGGALPR